MKECCTCKRVYEDALFDFRSKARGIRHPQCRECLKAARKRHYDENKAYYVERTAIRNELVQQQNHLHMWNVLASSSCLDCGESDPIVLEFDHRDPKEKHKNISALLRSWSWKAVVREMDKCDVRCRNCHARRTAEQFDWWKYKMAKSLTLKSDVIP